MQYTPLSLVQQRITIGAPLPFNIRDNDGTLLLARGQMIASMAFRQALFERGALVDLAELRSPAADAWLATPEQLPGLWTACLDTLGQTLRESAQEGFVDALDEAAPPVVALIERDKDLAIFQVLRQQGNALAQYGIDHSMHAAITGFLVAQRLGWAADDALLVFKVALTMNISMLELQGQLAVQTTPPSAEQRAAILAHPEISRRMLEISGVTDKHWLAAVDKHHETPDGQGYPLGLNDPGDIATLVHLADVYTAKLSPRHGRDAVAADKAGRMMFMQDPGHPMTAALVKEFGVYPPGCMVRLASGETGLVVKRGPTVMTPVVAVMTSPTGASLAQPERRNTAEPGFAVHSVLQVGAGSLRISPAVLMAIAT